MQGEGTGCSICLAFYWIPASLKNEERPPDSPLSGNLIDHRPG